MQIGAVVGPCARFDDHPLVVGRDFHQHFAGANDAADGGHRQPVDEARDWCANAVAVQAVGVGADFERRFFEVGAHLRQFGRSLRTETRADLGNARRGFGFAGAQPRDCRSGFGDLRVQALRARLDL